MLSGQYQRNIIWQSPGESSLISSQNHRIDLTRFSAFSRGSEAADAIAGAVIEPVVYVEDYFLPK